MVPVLVSMTSGKIMTHNDEPPLCKYSYCYWVKYAVVAVITTAKNAPNEKYYGCIHWPI